MKVLKKTQLVKFVLFSNGVIDLFAAIALFFPVFKFPLPGYALYTNQLAFVAGGWGIAALTFGIGRIWASCKSEFYWIMVILGLVEGVLFYKCCFIGNKSVTSNLAISNRKCIRCSLFCCTDSSFAFGHTQLGLTS